MNHIDTAIRELETTLKNEEARLGQLALEQRRTELSIQKGREVLKTLKSSFYGVVRNPEPPAAPKKHEWSDEQRAAASARMKAIHAARQGASA